ncbi:hypothetical protein [Sinorhizobium meliloti]|jgi:hypothetical protein|uniref:Uncharacterized protein n=1 Tax=Sinorhizobium meliloti (strain SM11) TaxID=707241 RepID=F7X1C4_SINMM|nr:hypothetical protein [Sinorhizobium meliloti]TWA91160.1 hypothetical protein FB000_13258 [Ensifer sp. SEMIA 134]TWB27887.1 hypothetical protein FB001_12932 [Ensifer sp. SEMIA 135]AEG05088.1 hypothetical protein SinmeB_2185 [Sinorhizobium meliloti BL225C]AEG54120.1 hypothetical protein Sinme_2403 [Sinorhizobium meliloti AK83]AEH78100.1 hypothetical protein SM11_chr0822 [Sinorhizobium meliloti SM11]
MSIVHWITSLKVVRGNFSGKDPPMTDLNKALAAAAEKGLISADRVNDLDAFISARE